MTKRMRNFRWESSPLGAVAQWPHSLRIAIGILTGSQFPMLVLWGPDRLCLYNDGHIPMLGLRHPQALAQPIREVWPEIWSTIGPLMERAYAGESIFFEHLPLQVQRNGVPEDVSFTFSYSALRNESGEIEGVLCVCTETTEHCRIEAALQQSESRLRGLAQTLPNHIWTAQPDGLLGWFNDRFYEYTGAPKGLLDSNLWSTAVHPDDRDMAFNEWSECILTGRPYQTEVRLRRADGRYRWHIVRATPLRAEDGSIERWIGTNTDIEERKLTEEGLEALVGQRSCQLENTQAELRQAQKMEAVGQLTGGIAHDFNNMLTGVKVAFEMIQLQLDNGNLEDVSRYATIGMDSAERAAVLTHRLLAFSRRQPLELQSVCVNATVRSMEDLIRRTLGSKVELNVCVSDDLWLTRCDPNQLEMALLNLAINARDAMPGGGALKVSTANKITHAEATMETDESMGEYVCLTVTDDGVGMSPETLRRVFEPFFTTKPIGQGTGLGLAMVYAFAKQSNGLVRIASREGVGTDIRIYLPRFRPDGQLGEIRSNLVEQPALSSTFA